MIAGRFPYFSVVSRGGRLHGMGVCLSRCDGMSVGGPQQRQEAPGGCLVSPRWGREQRELGAVLAPVRRRVWDVVWFCWSHGLTTIQYTDPLDGEFLWTGPC